MFQEEDHEISIQRVLIAATNINFLIQIKRQLRVRVRLFVFAFLHLSQSLKKGRLETIKRSLLTSDKL